MWENDIWNYYGLATYTYDASSNLLMLYVQEWGSNSWFDYAKETYTYDKDGNELTFVLERSDGYQLENQWKY